MQRPHLKKAIGYVLLPVLASRPITRVKSQQNSAGNAQSLIRKERDYTFKRAANVAHMFHHVPLCTMEVHEHLGLDSEGA